MLKHSTFLPVCRIHGYEADSMHTYAKLSAVLYSGLSFGSVFGPPISGVVTEMVGYPWLMTALAFVVLVMVCYCMFVTKLSMFCTPPQILSK